MADNELQNDPKKTECTDEQEQQSPINGSTEDSNTNNVPEQLEYSRDDDRKIFVGGLTSETTENDLNKHFGQFGEIESINVKVDPITGVGRGFAFIVFKTIEGLDNALASSFLVINDKKIYPKKAKARHVKLFVGGLSADLTDDDIRDYFKRFAPLVNAVMPFDKVRNQRRGFCFVTFDCMQAVTEILKTPQHIINGKQVDVRKAAFRVEYPGVMPRGSGPMRGMRGSFRGQGGRGGFQSGRQSGYAPSYGYAAYDYYNQYAGCRPDYSYGYTGYGAAGPGTETNYRLGYEAQAPRSVQGNRGGKVTPQRKPVKGST